jgi:hypothetical protein
MTGRATPLWPEGLSEISVYTVLPRTMETAPADKRLDDRRERRVAEADRPRRGRAGSGRRIEAAATELVRSDI